MEITSKQRAKLKGMASVLSPIIHIGKGEITEEIVKQTKDALVKRELIKGVVLQSSNYTVKEVSEVLEKQTDSTIVHIIGSKFVLYKRNDKKPKIEI